MEPAVRAKIAFMWRDTPLIGSDDLHQWHERGVVSSSYVALMGT